MVKITGAEWKRFYSEAFPDGTWHEEEEITIDGRPAEDDETDLSEVPDAARMTVSGGVIFLPDSTECPSLETYFKRWRKTQTTTVLIVEVPNERADAVREAVVAAGGKVRK